MAAPSIPAGLPKERVAAYNDLYDMLGPDAAADYASQFGIKAPVTTTVAAPAPTPAPVTLNLQPGPGGRIVNMPVGTTPPPVPVPEVREQLQTRESIPQLRMSQDELAEAAIKARTIVLQRTGLDYDTARSEAEKAVGALRNAPRTIEFKPKPTMPPGYSELAVRGQELLPRLSTPEVVVESIKPQVLETESQAEGRRSFEERKRQASSDIEAYAKSNNKSFDDAIDLLRAKNTITARQIAEQQFGPNPTPKQVKDIQDALDAPLYAARDDMGFRTPNQMAGEFASDTLRALTQEERQGRLVETRGAAALRNIGGLTRIAVRGAEEYLVEPLVKGVVAASDPNVSYSDLTKMEEDAIKAGGGVAIKSGVKGAGVRAKVETGSFIKDVAQEVATGRSSIDDYIDAGVPTGVATIIGLATEFAIPATPFGVVSDVVPAFGAVGKAIPGVARGAEAFASLRPVAATIRFGDALTNIPEATRLSRLAKETNAEGELLGMNLSRNMKSPGWWKTSAELSDMRTTIARKVADEVGDAAMIETFVRQGDQINYLNALDKGTMQIENNIDTFTSNFAADVAQKMGMQPSDLQYLVQNYRTAIRTGKPVGAYTASVIPKLEQAMKEVVGASVKKLASKESSDLVRNTYAATKGVQDFDVHSAALRAAVAEVLEKVPSSQYAFVTPKILVKKSIINSKEFQDAMSAAVAGKKTIAEVEKAVEDVIRSTYKAPGQIAEPSAVTIQRSEGLFPEAPSGGLERLATPEQRRLPVLEVAQDIRDTVKAIAAEIVSPYGNKRVTGAFASSPFIGGTQRTLDTALKSRVPVQMRDFIVATKSEIEALGVITARGAGGLDVKNPIIAAIRDNPDGLDGVLLERMSSGENRIGSGVALPMNVIAKSANEGVETIVRNFFGEANLTSLTVTDANAIIKQAVKNAVKNSNSPLEASLLAVKTIREEIPELANVGRRGTGLARGQDDIVSACLDYIIKEEAKVIFKNNFEKSYPELVRVSRERANQIGASVYGELSKTFGLKNVPGGWTPDTPFDINEFLRRVREFSKVDANQVEMIEFAQDAIKKRITDGALDPANPSVFNLLGTRSRKFINLVNQAYGPEAATAYLRAFNGVISNETQGIMSFIEKYKLIRPIDENDIVVFINNELSLPLPSSSKKIIEEFIGPISDLTKSGGVLSDNLTAISRSTNSGMVETVSSAVRSVFDTVRGLSASGLTTGVILPNPKFFSLNYLGAPFIMALTSPGLAMRAMASELGTIGINIGDLGATNVHFVRRAAQETPDAIAFTSKSGIPYTYKQLDDFMNESYFGMTAETFSFANKFGEDVRIEVGLNHGGTPVSMMDASRDKVQRLLNVSGTNLWTKWASTVDTNWRQQVFLGAMKSGQTAEQARRVASNAVLDYGRIPDSMRTVARRYMTFFSWFAVSNAEVFSALFRPAAASNISKIIRGQRELHKGFGDWTYSTDDTKKRFFAADIGNYDDLPAFYVGPENPIIGPLVDQVSLVNGLTSILASAAPGGAPFAQTVAGAGEQLAAAVVDKSFTPFLGYLSDIGVLGEAGAKGKVIPARQISFHQKIDEMFPGHFGQWMSDNNVTTIEQSERRPGEPTFYGQQYMYASEDARKKSAFYDYMYVMFGLNRLITDMQQAGMTIAPAAGLDAKRFEATGPMGVPLNVLQYFAAGSLPKGTNEHEAVRSAIISTNAELRKISENQ